MKESTLLEIYCPMLAIPFWFILYTCHRLRRHWNDGKESQKSRNTLSLYIKYTLIIGMLLVTVTQVLLTIYYNEDISDIKTIKLVLFSAFIVAWTMSFVMLRLEFSLRLTMKWIGHRSFWPINFVIYTVLFVMECVDLSWSFWQFFHNLHLITNSVGLVICLILTTLALLRPSEYPKSKDDVSANLIKKARFSVGVRNSTPEDRGLAGAVQVSIKNYKIKVENNKQVVLYNITIKIKGEVYKIRRTYHEFDRLYKAIRRSFPLEVFPYMSFPSFPIFTGSKLTIEQKTLALNEFLVGLCCPEFMLTETLDFLNIKGNFRDKLLEEHQEILEAEKSVMISEQDENFYASRESFVADNKISIFEKSSKLHTHLHVFFKVSVGVLEQASNKKEFLVSWVLVDQQEKKEVVKGFKEFSVLNGTLKKVLGLAILPKFPEKSYVQNLRKFDSQALEIRRRKLEKYLSHLLNDPGFLCQELLDFITCTTDLNTIIEKPCESEYDLSGPVGWEGELDGDSSYIIYILSFSKYFEGKKVSEWSVKRSFKDFQYMDMFLNKRSKSTEFVKYLTIFNQKTGDWPKLPTKFPTNLSNPNEIEICRSEIQNYMEELCSVALIGTAYAFKCFIDDPDPRF